MQYILTSVGDSALLLSFGNMIDPQVNRRVNAVAEHFREHPFTGLTDLVPAYSSLLFCYDPFLIHSVAHVPGTVYSWVKDRVEIHLQLGKRVKSPTVGEVSMLDIPVCYDDELGNDLEAISRALDINVRSIVELHTSRTYTVYMLGFLPGFAYMGTIAETIEIPRKPAPVPIRAGSVAIAGKQTGIYPIDSFGGWHVLGHTPLKTWEPAQSDPCRLHAGMEIRFYEVDLQDYRQLLQTI